MRQLKKKLIDVLIENLNMLNWFLESLVDEDAASEIVEKIKSK